jgi:hypothetical protein
MAVSGEKSGSQMKLLGRRRKMSVKPRRSGETHFRKLKVGESQSTTSEGQDAGIRKQDHLSIELGLESRSSESTGKPFGRKNENYFMMLGHGANSSMLLKGCMVIWK